MTNKIMFEELEIVELIHNINENNLKSGERGTIVEIYKNGEAYEVEFVNPDGSTKALLTLAPNNIRPIAIETHVFFDTSFAADKAYRLVVKKEISNDDLYKNLNFGTETKKSKENSEEFHYPMIP